MDDEERNEVLELIAAMFDEWADAIRNRHYTRAAITFDEACEQSAYLRAAARVRGMKGVTNG